MRMVASGLSNGKWQPTSVASVVPRFALSTDPRQELENNQARCGQCTHMSFICCLCNCKICRLTPGPFGCLCLSTFLLIFDVDGHVVFTKIASYFCKALLTHSSIRQWLVHSTPRQVAIQAVGTTALSLCLCMDAVWHQQTRKDEQDHSLPVSADRF